MIKKNVLFFILTVFIISILSVNMSGAKTPDINKFLRNEINTGKVVVKVNNKKVVFTVPFNFSQLYPDASIRRVLYKICRYLKYYPSYSITVVGHTDNIPPKLASTKKRYPDLNAYSMGRALNVKNLLVRYGLKPSKIKTQGKGDSQSIASNDTKQGRAKNRRVEIIVDLGVAMIPSSAMPSNKNKPKIEVKNLNPKTKSKKGSFTPPKEEKLKGIKK